MAITTTLFSQYSTTSEMMTGVKAIIDGYGFFDTTVIDTENSKLTCTVDNVDFLVLTFDTSAMKITNVTLTSKNNVSTTISYTTKKDIIKIITTSKCFYLNASKSDLGIIIGKTKGDKIGSVYDGSSVASKKQFSTESIKASSDISTGLKNANITVLANMPVSTGADVMEDIYYIVSNETANVAGNYTLNGNNYYSDGYVMIAD